MFVLLNVKYIMNMSIKVVFIVLIIIIKMFDWIKVIFS